jgi:hypothetical protein
MATDIFAQWVEALEARHLADFRVQEVTRALRALSSAYVERRHALGRGGALDSAGKRAAFALFYAPLHFLVTREVIRALGQTAPPAIVDLGCGTGAAGAAWALEGGASSRVTGVDRHPWAVEEARWTYRQLRVNGSARVGDALRVRLPRGNVGIVAAYLLNELPTEAGATLRSGLIDASTHGARVLIVEPIARGVAPWWNEAAQMVTATGGRADEWRFRLDLPPLIRMLDRAAGLDHRELKARSLFMTRGG